MKIPKFIIDNDAVAEYQEARPIIVGLLAAAIFIKHEIGVAGEDIARGSLASAEDFVSAWEDANQ